jgi:hypothetical protein
MDYYFADFTETAYRDMLRAAKVNWEFIDFTAYQSAGRVCLWRHDMDMSCHRACRLAQIESEEGVKATYFIHLHNEFYNPLEKEVAEIILHIQEMGHCLGLHFDPGFYTAKLSGGQDIVHWLKFEQNLLSQIFHTEIRVFSFHNPDVDGNCLSIDQNEIAGMINTYGRYFKEHYTYISDSNGYWRFRRLRDVLAAVEIEKLHVLTHPDWWQAVRFIASVLPFGSTVPSH